MDWQRCWRVHTNSKATLYTVETSEALSHRSLTSCERHAREASKVQMLPRLLSTCLSSGVWFCLLDERIVLFHGRARQSVRFKFQADNSIEKTHCIYRKYINADYHVEIYSPQGILSFTQLAKAVGNVGTLYFSYDQPRAHKTHGTYPYTRYKDFLIP